MDGFEHFNAPVYTKEELMILLPILVAVFVFYFVAVAYMMRPRRARDVIEEP